MAIAAVSHARQFLNDPSVTREDVWKFWSRLDSDSERASGAILRRLATIVTIWFATCGIAVNAVKEAGWVGYKVVDLSYLVLFAPLIIALLCHDAAALAALSTVRAIVERSVFDRLFPKGTPEQRYVMTVSSRATLTLERLVSHDLTGTTSGVFRASSYAVLALVFLVPLAAFAHTLFLSVSDDTFEELSRLPVVLLASLAFLRALGVFGIALQASKDAA